LAGERRYDVSGTSSDDDGVQGEREAGKQAAGVWAAEQVEDGMLLGLGTGSTIAYFLDAVAERGLEIAGVPTSEATAERCRELGIALLEPAAVHDLDLVVDGADEIDRSLHLTKGGGGALLREKVVASGGAPMIVVATVDKRVERLGDSFPIPVEVVPFAVEPVGRILTALGFEVTARGEGDYRTDNGNAVLDARYPGGIEDPEAMEVVLSIVPGVVENGLFIDLADLAVLGDDDGEVELVGGSPPP
jgi:ribose 5-phosphate isomerase A